MKLSTLILLSILAVAVSAEPQSEPGHSVQTTQAEGFWVDPATGLMWAARDNGKDVTWQQAVEYCHGLRIAGFSDWRLATLGELAGIDDKSANAPSQVRTTARRCVIR
jgi:hypothetical protein